MNFMPILLQINVTANWGSTGKIAEDIGKVAIKMVGKATLPMAETPTQVVLPS